MCGILGQIRLKKHVNQDVDRFNSALDLMTHRGPDYRAVSVDENYMFGHRRLSIIDLSTNAAQPMHTVDKRVVITFNGEIYNYKDLRHDLEQHGYKFKTTSDTEVLLNGYHKYGIKYLNRLNGMFAFSIYDKRSKCAYIVRDRIGIKPLYYSTVNGRLTFSSEIKSILAFEDISRTINMDAISSYLSYRYPVLHDTFFEGVYSLPPGHFIEVNNGNYAIKEYWNPVELYHEQGHDRGEKHYSLMMKELLTDAVRSRMVSDVPIGSILSGGVDSAIITALMSELSGSRPSTFTIGYDEPEYNEYSYAKIIADKYNTHHHEIITDGEEYFKNMERLIRYKDAPLSIPNEVTQYEMCSILKRDVTVILSGSGADESFLGYGRIFRSVHDYDRLKNIDKYSSSIDRDIFLKGIRSKYGVTRFSSELDHFINIYGYTSSEVKQSLLHRDFPLASIDQRIFQHYAQYFDRVPTGKYIDKMAYTFLKVHQPGVLQHNDITSMASGVELRVPFLDHRLVEFAMTVPEKYKLKWKTSRSMRDSINLMSNDISEKYDIPKYLLKKSFEREIPEDVLYRNKVGFPVPLHLWIGSKFNKYASEILLDQTAMSRQIYDRQYIESCLKANELNQHSGDSRTYQSSMATKIWMLMNLELFFKKYFD